MVKKIFVLFVLIVLGQVVGLIFMFFLDDFGKEILPPMAVSSTLVWVLYLQQNKDKKEK